MKTSLRGAMALLCLSLTAACGKVASLEDSVGAASVDPTEAIVEAGMTLVSGIADEQTGASLALRSEKSPGLWQLFLPTAQAVACSRAMTASCLSGVKTANYGSCDVNGTNRSMSGTVTLTYSDSACSMASVGDQVVRTYDIGIQGPRGGLFSLSSAAQSDYTGASYGGGGRLTKTSAGWDLEVLGRHSRLSINDRTLASVSVRTLSALGVTGGLTRSSRVVNGGQLQVNHNVAGFTALIQPVNLHYSNTCCHPTSGSLNITYFGSKSGSATVTFASCGSAQLSEGGQTRNLAFSYCE